MFKRNEWARGLHAMHRTMFYYFQAMRLEVYVAQHPEIANDAETELIADDIAEMLRWANALASHVA